MAAVASILEVGLEDLPDLFERCCIRSGEGDKVRWEDSKENWWNVLMEGIEAHGWTAIYSLQREGENPPPGYVIAGGPSGRAFTEDGKDAGHVVVCLDGEMVHDPHPDRTGLAGPISDWIVLYRPPR